MKTKALLNLCSGWSDVQPCALWFTEADMWVSMCVCLKTAALPEPCIIMSAVALTKGHHFFLSIYVSFSHPVIPCHNTQHICRYEYSFSMSHLRIQVSKDIHSGFLHHGEQIWVVISPFHIPDILALEFRWISRCGPALCIPWRSPCLYVQKRQHACNIYNSQPAKKIYLF